MDMDLEAQILRAHEVQQQRLRKYIILIVALVSALFTAVSPPILLPALPQPYHTSALTGADWVLELLTGHPRRIHTELGVSVEVFQALVEELMHMGYTHSRHVSIHEQLAIFLYTCVTGLSIRHVGERFQRSNDTISR